MIIYSLYINIITKSSSYPSISYNFCYHCFQGKKCDHLWHRILRWFQRDIHFSHFLGGLRLTCDLLATYLRLSCDLLATYLRLTCDLLATYLRLTCYLLATYLLLTCDLAATYLLLTCYLLATYLRLTCDLLQIIGQYNIRRKLTLKKP